MGTDKLRTCPSCLEDGRSLKTILPGFDFDTLIENMKQSRTWAKGDLDAIILIKNPEKKIILTALHEGTIINSFQANDSVSFQVIEGKMKFQTKRESLNLYNGQLLTLHENVNYTLTTVEETVFLLTVSNSA